MATVEVEGMTYHIHNKLKNKWDEIKDGKLTKEDDDRVLIVDGRERSGKSLWTLQQAAYIDQTFIKRFMSGRPTITFTPGANSLNLEAIVNEGFDWSEVTGTSQSMSVGYAYIANNTIEVINFTLPSTSAVGDLVAIVGNGAGKYKISSAIRILDRNQEFLLYIIHKV